MERMAEERMRLLIVDDEAIARRGLRMSLQKLASVEIAGEARDGAEAVKAIRELSPDLVLLDVQMAEMDGFQVIETVGTEKMPPVIFVTAYDQFALKAFEVHALDYVLKPVDPERLRDAVERARRHRERDRMADLSGPLDQLLRYVRERPGAPAFTKRIVVKERGKIFFVDVAEIAWIESVGNYVELHAGRNKHLLRQTMNELEQKLDPQQFVRIRRSAMVNVRHVKEFRPFFKGSHQVILKDGAELTSSRRYRHKLQTLFRQ